MNPNSAHGVSELDFLRIRQKKEYIISGYRKQLKTVLQCSVAVWPRGERIGTNPLWRSFGLSRGQSPRLSAPARDGGRCFLPNRNDSLGKKTQVDGQRNFGSANTRSGIDIDRLWYKIVFVPAP